MHVLSFEAENYKRLRIVEIKPKGRLIQITGGNGEGKTSVIDALWAAIIGKYAIPEKPVRKGAKNSPQKFVLGDFKTGVREIIGKRIIKEDRTTAIELWNADGTKYSNPQAMLNDLVGDLTFDPLEFVRMDTRGQVAMLRTAAKVDYDFDTATEANAADFKARTIVNREVDRLEKELAAFTVQDGLPAEKINEVEILTRIEETDAVNRKAKQIDDEKRNAHSLLVKLQNDELSLQHAIGATQERIDKILSELKREEALIEDQRTAHANAMNLATDAAKSYEKMPDGEPADVIALTKELQHAQLVNREIDRRDKRTALDKELRGKKTEAATLSRQIEKRDEQKAAAIAQAKLPVEGLTFDETTVAMNGIPINQLGEAEQITVSARIAMSANPKLRILRVMNGEALDENNLGALAKLAEEHDFQIWMTRVDTSGKVGIVMEDGEVKADYSEVSNGND